ncbi:MAG TPA: hypothetical protein VFK28_10320 [Sphingomicrobium sp.]|nr:hypothetical protein [Sphingomicrobium sp.]
MLRWLVVGAAVSLGWASPASAQLKGLSPAEIAGVARRRALDFRISPQAPVSGWHPLVDGMLVSQNVAPNAKLGIGFGNVYGRKKAGSDVRITGGPHHSRKPAIKFVMRF